MNEIDVAHIITGLSRGGAERALYRLIENQEDPRRQLVVSLTDEGIYGARLRALGVVVLCLGLSRRATVSPLPIWRIARWLRAHRPSVAQTWMYHADLLGGLAGRLAGVPVVWGIRQSNLSSEGNKWLTIAVARLCALLSRWVPKRIVSCSARARDLHLDFGYSDRFVVIPNGLDLGECAPLGVGRRQAVRQDLGVDNEAMLIGHVGRADPQKDHLTLLRTFKQVHDQRPGVVLLLVGQELEHGSAYLTRLLAEVGAPRLAESIIALGPRDDVADLMGAMDVFLLSSIGEAFPNVVAEAMACGTPCVVTDVGDAAMIVGDTGWVAAPKDVNELSRCALAALNEPPSIRAARKVRARRRVEENFSIDRMVNAYREVWQSVLRRD